MSSKKLQGEIDKTIKKINEGIEEFHQLWTKFENTTNVGLKEKYESDLKREIKKLQRLRDQIKAWQLMPEIKDKNALNDARKSIENEMEKFKALEKETKIKAFSKEGLIQGAKISQAEKERNEIRTWITESVETLNTQIESIEAELEGLAIVSSKKSSSKANESESLQKLILKHKFHIEKLEACLRLFDNDEIDAAMINNIKDGIDYYISSNRVKLNISLNIILVGFRLH